jgi:hypothetical protein
VVELERKTVNNKAAATTTTTTTTTYYFIDIEDFETNCKILFVKKKIIHTSKTDTKVRGSQSLIHTPLQTAYGMVVNISDDTFVKFDFGLFNHVRHSFE